MNMWKCYYGNVEMFNLRKQQHETIAQAERQRFEDWMVGHLNRFFPEHCVALGEDGVRQAIADGISRSENYGIISQRDVCKYTDMMFAYGRKFDENESLPWAAEILNDESLEGQPSKKMDRLIKAGKRNLFRGHGKVGAEK